MCSVKISEQIYEYVAKRGSTSYTSISDYKLEKLIQTYNVK